MSAPILYQEGAPIPTGSACLTCGATETLANDHCHKHGWVRGVLCGGCNVLLSRIDMRARPRRKAISARGTTLRALLEHAGRCPECALVAEGDLIGPFPIHQYEVAIGPIPWEQMLLPAGVTHEDQMLTVAEVAARSGKTVRTVRRWIAGGQIPAYRIGTCSVRIAEADLNVFLAPRRIPAGETEAAA